jgi:Spy/CpxP family protein refolding chaperone
MTIIRISTVLSALLIHPLIIFAQLPGMTAWWNQPVVRDLGLNDEQQKQIRIVVRESRGDLIELRAAVQKAEARLEDEMDEERLNSGRAEEAIEKVIAARSELMRAVSRMSLKLRMILTSAQWQELKKRQGRRPNALGIRNPGKIGPGQIPRSGAAPNAPSPR